MNLEFFRWYRISALLKQSVSKNKLGRYMKFDLSIFFLQTNSFNFRVDENILILKYIIFKVISEELLFAIMINNLVHIKNQSFIDYIIYVSCFLGWLRRFAKSRLLHKMRETKTLFPLRFAWNIDLFWANTANETK